MNNKTIILIHSFGIRPYVSSFVRRPVHPSKPVSPFVSSFLSFVLSSLRFFVCPSIHSFTRTYSFLLLAYSCVVRMSRMSNRTIGGHQSMGLLSRKKLKTIHFLRKPTNNLITKLNKTCKKIKQRQDGDRNVHCWVLNPGGGVL